MTYTSVLHTKRMRYYRRSSFSGLELHANYDWRATAPSTHHHIFLISHFVRISSITPKPQGDSNSTTHQATPLIPTIACFMLKTANRLQSTSYGPVRTSLSGCFVCKYEWQQNLRRLRLYYASINCFPTKVASFRSTKWSMTYKLPSSCYRSVFALGAHRRSIYSGVVRVEKLCGHW